MNQIRRLLIVSLGLLISTFDVYAAQQELQNLQQGEQFLQEELQQFLNMEPQQFQVFAQQLQAEVPNLHQNLQELGLVLHGLWVQPLPQHLHPLYFQLQLQSQQLQILFQQLQQRLQHLQ